MTIIQLEEMTASLEFEREEFLKIRFHRWREIVESTKDPRVLKISICSEGRVNKQTKKYVPIFEHAPAKL